MSNGYWGRILRVDLTQGRTEIEEQGDRFYRRYLGGAGVIAQYLLKETHPGVDALDPGNVLVFAPGVITGVPLAGAGRNGVGAKSPLTGGLGQSEVGGFWGAELKHAGFDAIVVTGRAHRPVYLYVHDGEAEIRDAIHLWGMLTLEAQEAIQAELGDHFVRVAQIGPGGENLVRFACVINDLRYAAGRTGMGAVMGSKNLKAIAVRGHGQVGVAEPAMIRDIAHWLGENKHLARWISEYGSGIALQSQTRSGNLPVRNFRDGFFEQADALSAETIRSTIGIGMEGCYACRLRCKKICQVKEPYEVDPRYGGPEYETAAAFGSDCGISDLKAVARAHHLCNAYGIDTIAMGATVAFAMECFENGLISTKDTGGLELRFGNSEAMLKLVDMSVRREGLGAVLAEGSRRAAQAIGGGAERFSMAVKGVELGMHEPRLKHGLGLGYGVVARGADHCIGLMDTVFETEGRALQVARQLGWLDTMPANELSARKAALFVDMHNWRTLMDSAIMCVYLPYDYSQVSGIIGSVTGWNTTVRESLLVGERAVTMARAFNVREGLSRADDMLPERFFSPPANGTLGDAKQAISHEQFEAATTTYYRLMGWDPETGVPTSDKLESLGIGWVADTTIRLERLHSVPDA